MNSTINKYFAKKKSLFILELKLNNKYKVINANFSTIKYYPLFQYLLFYKKIKKRIFLQFSLSKILYIRYYLFWKDLYGYTIYSLKYDHQYQTE